MLEKLRQKAQYFEFYDQDNIPLNKECYLLGDASIEIIERQWLAYCSDAYDMETREHPNAITEYIPFNIISSDQTSFSLNLLLDRSQRFHSITRTLPKKFFRIGFLPFTSEKRPFIIVDQNWIDQLRLNLYSTYVIIDFIGTNALLKEYGEFPIQKLISIKGIIDKFSSQNPAIQFLSCADNIIIKAGWAFGSYDQCYKPEKLIEMVNQIMVEIRQHADISSYAIFTQGANYVNEKILPYSPSPVNHLFISSISTPFIENFAIDEHVRIAIREKKITGQAFYLERSFYISTNRKYSSGQEPFYFKTMDFEHKKSGKMLGYIPLSYSQIFDLVEMNP